MTFSPLEKGVLAMSADQVQGYDPTASIVKSPQDSPSRGRYVSVAVGIEEGWLLPNGRPTPNSAEDARIAAYHRKLTQQRNRLTATKRKQR